MPFLSFSSSSSFFTLFSVFLTLPVLLFFASASVFGGEWKILTVPAGQEPAYTHAAQEFQKYYALVTGKTLEITDVSNDSDSYVILGSDAVQPFVRALVERHVLADFPLKTASDDYRLLSVKDGEREHLILAGGRGRSTLYAVYDFFERRPGCRWFWDGDVLPKRDSIDFTALDVTESPRFEYRGLRYFAHRGLTRFQAEHWGLDDWKQEIDWMLKKRLNIFMLRIGMDDLFQKAFPDIVKYPDPAKPLPEAIEGYDNRSLFWSLEFRGKLRHDLLAYAFDRDLMHPEDFGTMSHWYSRTPKSFLEAVKPGFLPQEGGAYGAPTDLVWDIRKDENLENYWKLTRAHIENYGKPELFHTIGIAERHCYRDRAENQRMKLYAYRRLIQTLRREYPNAKLLLAGWDFYWGWTPEEMRNFTAQLDPENTLIWDYEADALGENNFTNWGVVGKFPYVFGIFQAYESALDIRGRYDIILPRQKIAESDPFCRGFILWPENSHADIFMLHYFTANAWNPGEKSIPELLTEFCHDRYGEQADAMNTLWTEVLPISQLLHWGGNFWTQAQSSLHGSAALLDEKLWENAWKQQAPSFENVDKIYEQLSEIRWTDDFLRRDSIDLARTVLDRELTFARITFWKTFHTWRSGTASGTASETEFRAATERYAALTEGMTELLALHEDYSLADAYDRLGAIEPIQNPEFSRVLLENAACSYCMSHQYEPMKYWYAPSIEGLIEWARGRLNTSDKTPLELSVPWKDGVAENYEAMMALPLAQMRPTTPRTEENFQKLMRKLAEISKVSPENRVQ